MFDATFILTPKQHTSSFVDHILLERRRYKTPATEKSKSSYIYYESNCRVAIKNPE